MVSFTAVLGEDYTGMPATKVFHTCQRRMCTQVFIVDDNVVENPENLRVSIRSGTPLPDRITFSSSYTDVQIMDNDCKCVQYIMYIVCMCFNVFIRCRDTFGEFLL